MNIFKKKVEFPGTDILVASESQKNLAMKTARQFCTDMDESMHVFKQFFDISPKLGDFGDVSFSRETRISMELAESFLPGYIVRFYLDIETLDIAGISTTKKPIRKHPIKYDKLDL